MKNFLKNSVLLGLGIYSKAEKEMEKTIKGLIKNNKITRKEGEAALSKFVKSSRETEEKIEREIKKNVDGFVKRVTLAKQKDLVALERRLKKLEAELSSKKSGKKS